MALYSQEAIHSINDHLVDLVASMGQRFMSVVYIDMAPSSVLKHPAGLFDH